MSVTPEGAPTRPAYIRDANGLYYQVGGIAPDVFAQPTAPPAGATPVFWVDTDDLSMPSPVAVTGRNRIINGDFSVNQRGFTSNAGNTYGFDRWAAGNVGPLTYSAQTPALGELPESARAYARLVTSGQAAVGDYAMMAQQIESVRTLSGKTVTISFWAKAASGTPKASVEITQTFGAGGSPSPYVSINVGQVTLSTSWMRYSLTGNIPSIAGKILGTGNDDKVGIIFWTSAGSNYNARTGSLGIQNNTFDFWGVQVEEGTVATQFEQKSYADELRACQRYYYRITSAFHSWTKFGVGVVTTTSRAVMVIPFLVSMRTAPTPTATGSMAIWDGTNQSPITVFTPDGATPFNFAFDCTGSANLIIGRSAILLAYSTTSASLEFSAEL